LLGCRMIILSHFGKAHLTWKSPDDGDFELCGIPDNPIACTAFSISCSNVALTASVAALAKIEDFGLVGDGTGVPPQADPTGTMARLSDSMEDVASAATLDQSD